MKKKEITIAGKQVMLAYCFATELIYSRNTGSTFREFISSIFDNIQGKDASQAQVAEAIINISPSVRLAVIVAAINAYYDAENQLPPVTEADIARDATPAELMEAIGTILTLHNEWYNITPEEVPQKKGKKGKN